MSSLSFFTVVYISIDSLSPSLLASCSWRVWGRATLLLTTFHLTWTGAIRTVNYYHHLFTQEAAAATDVHCFNWTNKISSEQMKKITRLVLNIRLVHWCSMNSQFTMFSSIHQWGRMVPCSIDLFFHLNRPCNHFAWASCVVKFNSNTGCTIHLESPVVRERQCYFYFSCYCCWWMQSTGKSFVDTCSSFKAKAKLLTQQCALLFLFSL